MFNLQYVISQFAGPIIIKAALNTFALKRSDFFILLIQLKFNVNREQQDSQLLFITYLLKCSMW